MTQYYSQTWQHKKTLPLRLEREAYYQMKARCYNPKHNRYYKYGARGIEVCERWLESFDNFFADMGGRPTPKHQLDRIDNDSDYRPDNCRWVLPIKNARNKGLYSNNKSGFRGVSQRGERWYARIPIDGKDIHIGSFLDKDDAISARLGAEASLW